MRNLKKVLTLVLTLAMLLSVMVVGAGAAFTDQESIGNKEAVDACVALNIIGGYEDGTFRPNNNVTRAEMCKMLCIVLNGGVEPTMSTNANSTYNDVRGTGAAWAEPYIEYCTNLGIVGGVGGGRFDPAGNVTGTQAAKMLLVALGFNPATEGYVGSSNWNTEINVDASMKHLYDQVEGIDTNAALSRNNAAQMIWNALGAYMVTYRNEFTTVNGQLVAKPVLVDKTSENSVRKITLLEDKYGVYRVEGIVVANEYVTLADTKPGSDAMKAGETSIIVTNVDEVGGTDGVLNVTGFTSSQTFVQAVKAGTQADTFNVTTGKNEIGKAVVLFVKPATSTKNTSKATVIGAAVMGDNTVMTATEKWTSQAKMDSALKDAGLKTSVPTAYYVNGVETIATFDNSVMTTGYSTQFIDNDGNGTVDCILVDQVDFGKVTSYSTKDDGSIAVATSISPVTKDDAADVVGFKDVAKNDYVLYSEVGGRLYVEKATSVSGKLTNFGSQGTGSGPDKGGYVNLWIDGAKYRNSDATKCADLTQPKNYQTLDETAVFYLDSCGYIVAVDGTAEKHYALATYYNGDAYVDGSITTAARAQVTFEDGKSGAPVMDVNPNAYDVSDPAKAIVTATKTALETLANGPDGNASAVADNNAAIGVVLGSYTYNSDDEMVLNSANNAGSFTATTGGTFEYTSGNVLVKLNTGNLQDGGNNAYMTKDTVVFVAETEGDTAINAGKVGKVTTYVGKDNVPNMKLTYTDNGAYRIVYITNADHEITAMAVIANKQGAITDNHLYVIEVKNTATDQKTVLAVVDGKVQEITVNSSKSATIGSGTLYEYAIDSEGNYDLKAISSSNIVPNKHIERINTNEKTVVVDGVEYKVLDKTDIADIDDEKMLDLAELSVGDFVTILKSSDGKEALGIYVHEKYDPSNANILTVASPVVATSTGYKVSAAAATQISDITDNLVISSKATATVIKTKDATTPANDTAAVDGDIVADAALYIKVTSENGTVAYYDLAVEA